MGALELRNLISEYVSTADERLLKIVKAVMESYREDDIAAYTIEGKALTKSEYRQELIDAQIEIEQGEYTTQEDLEKESENW
ncbi:hypothetical protein J8281_10535 [Aquimarina sp. U1-2]|uniref:hypothetical protein n=1 Tax=Aquimarina sp. U1-2 TaxID=2823141 RepID=UPI001AECB2B1|nr:hypothetical protein [Aquimarina sp. U1-2]MBP2832621.1 hypothetical protein [Aquimarina sp. U1-2]